MRILKRPSNSDSKSPTPPASSSTSETIKEREARYQAARERIFRDENGSGSLPSQLTSEQREGQSSSPALDTRTVSIVRNPRGPGGQATDDAERVDLYKGFGFHRAKPPLAPQDFSDVTRAEDSVT